MQFLVFCVAVLRAVNKWQGLLRASIASAGNDHRLGANEAPPAIISVFLGDMLTDIFEQIEKGGARSTKHGGELDTGVLVLPKLPRDAGDRNRTSPFAFTGNKFEFRAVSSNQSIAYPNIALNLAVTESLDYMATELEKATGSGKTLEKAVVELLQKVIKENKRIIFNGNNYSKEWEKEAGKRGLQNFKNTVDALPQLIAKEVVGIFEKYKVLNEREVHARYEIMVETYNKTVNVEGQLMVLMANRYILPAAFEYQTRVAGSVAAVKAAGGKSVEGKKMLDALTSLTDDFKRRTDKLAHELEHEGNGDAVKHAKHFRDKVIPAMVALREAGDELELRSRTSSGRSPPTGRCCSSSSGDWRGRMGSRPASCHTSRVAARSAARSSHPAATRAATAAIPRRSRASACYRDGERTAHSWPNDASLPINHCSTTWSRLKLAPAAMPRSDRRCSAAATARPAARTTSRSTKPRRRVSQLRALGHYRPRTP